MNHILLFAAGFVIGMISPLIVLALVVWMSDQMETMRVNRAMRSAAAGGDPQSQYQEPKPNLIQKILILAFAVVWGIVDGLLVIKHRRDKNAT